MRPLLTALTFALVLPFTWPQSHAIWAEGPRPRKEAAPRPIEVRPPAHSGGGARGAAPAPRPAG